MQTHWHRRTPAQPDGLEILHGILNRVLGRDLFAVNASMQTHWHRRTPAQPDGLEILHGILNRVLG
ncbi:hypothetical protein VS883_28850, partial [Escherichia coli]